jgi:hypothetical protein
MNEENTLFDVPFVAFGNDELDEKEVLKIGDKINCKNCGAPHVVKGGKDTETGEESDTLLFTSCGEKAFLVGIAGKKI